MSQYSKEFEKWYESEWKRLGYSHEKNDASLGWNACKKEILKILKENRELEAISQNGKKIYKIYGNVIDRIEKL